MSAVEASALASSSACTVVVWPLKAAPIRAVRPRESCRLTLAPCCSSIRTIASCPPQAAAISSVNGAAAAGSAAAVEGAALAFFFLPLPFLAAASFSASTSSNSSAAAASAAATACADETAALASASAVSALACCRSSFAVVMYLWCSAHMSACGVGLAVEQRLHDRGVAFDSSARQGGGAEGGFLQVDARAALQQHPHHRLLPSRGGHYQQRQIAELCAARVHAAALVQPRSHSLRVALPS
eukprot:scaffold43852_cov73-Phaeocystis_antarctica.AAC.7